jgi:hypothetical protein
MASDHYVVVISKGPRFPNNQNGSLRLPSSSIGKETLEYPEISRTAVGQDTAHTTDPNELLKAAPTKKKNL